MKDLGALGTTSISMANAINDAGVIAGQSQIISSGWDQYADFHACLWNIEGELVDLDLGGWGAAIDINNQGQVVGQLGMDGFFWTPTNGAARIHGWGQTVANAINEIGQVVGWTGGPVPSYAYIWTLDQGLFQIGTMESSAQGINNHGQVVGWYSNNGGFAFIWDSVHGMRDLNDLIPTDSGWILKGARDINDAGQIVVEAENRVTGRSHALLLTPVILNVAIDIKPGSDSNCFNQNDRGVIPVAIFGSADLDVTQIDINSLSLQGLSVKMAGKSNKYLAHYGYVNGDGYLDLIVQFQDGDGWTSSGMDNAILTGTLLDGTPIEGQDSICIVP